MIRKYFTVEICLDNAAFDEFDSEGNQDLTMRDEEIKRILVKVSNNLRCKNLLDINGNIVGYSKFEIKRNQKRVWIDE